ncbi:MAG: hypothetical protein K8R23_06285 [Chthoniobacter sp.]|nr:hypothetical protein [Chthoniobacter sp.]
MTAATQHKTFSLARVFAIASNTLLELVRLKVFYFLLCFALLFIAVSLATSTLTFQEQFHSMKSMALGGMSMFTLLLAVLSTAMIIPKDIEERTLYTILAKPVPRFEYLLGKLGGVLAMLLVAMALMIPMLVLVLYVKEQSSLAAASRSLAPGPDRDAALEQIRLAAFSADLIPGLIIIYLKAAVCASLTLLVSTFATSSIFTIIVSCMVIICGYVQHFAREHALGAVAVGTVSVMNFLVKGVTILAMLMIPDLWAFDILDDATGALPLDLFAQTASLGGVYIAAYFLIGYLIFAGKEL